MKALKDLVVPVAILLLATGCASANPFQHQGDFGSRTTQEKRLYDKAATLSLENNNGSDVTVYLLHLGTATRLDAVGVRRAVTVEFAGPRVKKRR